MHDIIRNHLEDLAAGNWSAYRAALDLNVIYDEVATKQRLQGADEYMASARRWKLAFPDLRVRIRDVVSMANRAVVEVEWEGTQRGVLEGAFGRIAPTNKPVRLRAMMHLRLEGGRIIEAHHYFDLLSLLAQLGYAPATSAVAGAITPRADATSP